MYKYNLVVQEGVLSEYELDRLFTRTSIDLDAENARITTNDLIVVMEYDTMNPPTLEYMVEIRECVEATLKDSEIIKPFVLSLYSEEAVEFILQCDYPDKSRCDCYLEDDEDLEWKYRLESFFESLGKK